MTSLQKRLFALAIVLFATLPTIRAGYDPTIGRWLSRDPIAEAGGINLYSSVFNNPVERIDPLGLDVYGYDFVGPLNDRDYVAGSEDDVADHTFGNGDGNIDPGERLFRNDALSQGLQPAWSPLDLLGFRGCPSSLGRSSPFVPEAALAKNAPKQVAPGTKTLEHTKLNSHTGQIEKSTAHYDQYGRQVGRTDYSTHGRPNAHTNPHHHTTEYGPGYAPGGKQSGPIPGSYPGK